MSQPPPVMAPVRHISPPQHSPSPVAAVPQAAHHFLTNNKPKTSPGSPAQPPSPYPPYGASPGPTTPGSANPTTGLAASSVPFPPSIQNPPNSNSMTTPYTQNNYQTNGGRAPSVGTPTAINTLSMPSPVIASPKVATPPPATPTNAPGTYYSNAHFASIPQPTTGNMGPPAINTSSLDRSSSKPSTAKETAYDMDDMLAGTGIDLDEETEQLNKIELNRGYGQYPPGARSSFYGTGPASQAAEQSQEMSQEELAAQSADLAWNEAAARLAVTRSQEMRQYLLEPGILHKKMHDITQRFGLALNLDLKPGSQTKYMGKMDPPHEFPKPEIKVSFKLCPDGTRVQTMGSFIPKDAHLVDQIALLSISTKEHIRSLLGDANKVATTRQRTAHGQVPPEWVDAAVPHGSLVNGTGGEVLRTGAESAVSPRTNPLKRSADELDNGLPTPVSEASPSNYVVDALLGFSKDTQNVEEIRLKKRQKRLEEAADKEKKNGDGTSRPGLAAPEQAETKAPTKKESKKAAAKVAEAASSTTVNDTLSLFAGGKKKKKYAWMQGSGSGASTPRPLGLGAAGPSTPGSTAGGTSKAAPGPLTKGSAHPLGQFREDSARGKNIQLRDWVVTLESNGFDSRTLQHAYDKMDRSDYGDKVATNSQL
ncbi:hypothetical protein F4778DRAFT_742963 [Xylariomycetidae sp. FL2044]|nr:hypothetical protein F4778DRAFT_742963 [Xylariomycetidae sp. FL2044]